MGQQIVLGGGFRNGETAVRVIKGHCKDWTSLRSNHEEADTRLLLHAQHAAGDRKRIVTNHRTLM